MLGPLTVTGVGRLVLLSRSAGRHGILGTAGPLLPITPASRTLLMLCAAPSRCPSDRGGGAGGSLSVRTLGGRSCRRPTARPSRSAYPRPARTGGSTPMTTAGPGQSPLADPRLRSRTASVLVDRYLTAAHASLTQKNAERSKNGSFLSPPRKSGHSVVWRHNSAHSFHTWP